MEGLRVAELAESAGLAPSTVRYYERVGLLSPARRATNGYRVFDKSATEELAFIARAKGIGMTLVDIAELVGAWPNGECRSLQARLRGFLGQRIAQVHDQLDELGTFEGQLQTVLGRLAVRDPGPERCGKGCGCETELDVTTEGSRWGPRAWGCSLGDEELTSRLGQWRSVVAAATSMEHNGEVVRLCYPVAAVDGRATGRTVRFGGQLLFSNPVCDRDHGRPGDRHHRSSGHSPASSTRWLASTR